MADDFKEKVDVVVDKAKEIADATVKAAAELAATIGEKTESFIGSAKRKFESEKLQATLHKKYRQLGKAYYDRTQSTSLSESLDELVQDIKATLAQIEELKNAPESEEAEAAKDGAGTAAADDDECDCADDETDE